MIYPGSNTHTPTHTHTHACLPVCPSAWLLACLSACLLACVSVCLSVCLSACLFPCLPACLPNCLPACQVGWLLAGGGFLHRVAALAGWLAWWRIRGVGAGGLRPTPFIIVFGLVFVVVFVVVSAFEHVVPVVYNIFKNNISSTNCFTTCPNIMLLELLALTTLVLNMSTVKCFSTSFGRNVVKPMFLATLCLKILFNQSVEQDSFWKCHKNNSSSNIC